MSLLDISLFLISASFAGLISAGTVYLLHETYQEWRSKNGQQ